MKVDQLFQGTRDALALRSSPLLLDHAPVVNGGTGLRRLRGELQLGLHDRQVETLLRYVSEGGANR